MKLRGGRTKASKGTKAGSSARVRSHRELLIPPDCHRHHLCHHHLQSHHHTILKHLDIINIIMVIVAIIIINDGPASFIASMVIVEPGGKPVIIIIVIVIATVIINIICIVIVVVTVIVTVIITTMKARWQGGWQYPDVRCHRSLLEKSGDCARSAQS